MHVRNGSRYMFLMSSDNLAQAITVGVLHKRQVHKPCELFGLEDQGVRQIYCIVVMAPIPLSFNVRLSLELVALSVR